MQKSILVALCWILLALVNAYPVDRKNERAILPEEDNELQNSQFHSRISGRASWSYSDTSRWPVIAPTCGGVRQSPIDIVPNSAVLTSYSLFSFNNYDNIGERMNAINNGHTVVLSLPSTYPTSSLPYISGGGLSDQYIFHSLHFHWGSSSDKGSEHRINSKEYAAELHLVHYKKNYGTFAEATTHDDGLAVLGVLIQVGQTNNAAFQPIIDKLSSVKNNNDATKLDPLLQLKSLLPSSTSKFYRYSGSLTTPNCNQIVVWTVFDTPVALSENQLSQFRGLIGDDGPLTTNFRPTQPLNGRTVTFRSDTDCQLRFSRTFPLVIPGIVDYASCLVRVKFYYIFSFFSG